MNEEKLVTIRLDAAMLALEAMRAIAKDKSSYIHRRFADDQSFFRQVLDEFGEIEKQNTAVEEG